LNSNSLYSLTAQGVQITIHAAPGERPRVVHWGKTLSGTPEDQLALLSTHQWVFGGPMEFVEPSFLNEFGTGYGGAAGLVVHRAGSGWAVDLRVVAVGETSATKLVVRCRDENIGVAVDFEIELFPSSGVASFGTTLINERPQTLTVDQCAPLVLPLDERFTKGLGFTGRWAGEFQTEDIDLTRGSYLRENKAGRTSHENFPGFIAHTETTSEDQGLCAGFHLAWSGNNRVRIDRHASGLCHAQLSEFLFPGEIQLDEGEAYHSPSLLAAWSDQGLNDLSYRFHTHLCTDVLDERTIEKPRPVHYNTWEAVYFDHTPEQLMKLADRAASVGAERYVLDDGWFGGRRGDHAGLGDWTVSDEVYPEGLEPLADYVRGLGMEFGIWFEPEMVNPDSDLYRQHPDWILSAEGVKPVPYRNQLTLDFTKREVTDYLFEAIDKVVRDLDVSYIKWDMNRDGHHPGTDGSRAVMHRQTLSVYGLIDRLREAHPTLEIESCASGGARTDFGVLRRTDRLWTSDNNDALERQAIQRGASHFFPLRVLGSHVGPRVCHITGRTLDMSFRVASAIFGHMGMEVDLRDESEADLAVLRAGIELYKKHRGLLHGGRLYRLSAQSNYTASAVVSVDGGEALASCAKVARDLYTAAPRLRFTGLDPAKAYRTKIVWPSAPVSLTVPSIVEAADLSGEGSVFSGEALMEHGIQLPMIHPDQALIFHLQTNG